MPKKVNINTQFIKQQKMYQKQKKVNDTINKKFKDWSYPVPPVFTGNWSITDWSTYIKKHGQKLGKVNGQLMLFDTDQKTAPKKAKKTAPKKAKKTAPKKARKKRPDGYQYGKTNIDRDKKIQALAPGKRISKNTGKPYYEYRANRTDKAVLLGTGSHKDTKSHNVNIRVVSGIKRLNGLFDTSIIDDIDTLKKEYFKLAKKYHPDKGGTTAQFQNLQNEYEELLKKLLAGSKLSNEEQANELIIDENIRAVIDQLIGIESINIELVGKWLWISGNTYSVRNELKKAGLIFIKKNGVPYWVYKGVESSGRGKMTIEEIKNKYGAQKVDVKQFKKITGVKIKNKIKLLSSLKRLTKAINKRPM